MYMLILNFTYPLRCLRVPPVDTTALDHRRNEDTLEEPKVDPVEKKLAHYKQKWIHHDSEMEETLDTQNNSLSIDLSKEDLDDRQTVH
jgi:hypothetical protein